MRSPRSLRLAAAAAVLLGVAAQLAPVGVPAQVKLQKMRFVRSIPPDLSAVYFYVAQDKGYFREYGLDAEMVTAQGTGAALTQLVGGNAEIANTSAEAMLNAIGQGQPMVAFWQFLQNGAIFGVLARRDRGVNGIEDLKGKTIGILGPASATRYATVQMLAKVGLKESDVNMVTLPGMAAYGPALARGQVDALGAWDVSREVVMGAGDDNFRKQLVYFPASEYLSDIFATSKKYFDGNKDAIASFMAAIVKSMDDIGKNPAEAIQIAAKYVPSVSSADPAVNAKIIELRNQKWVKDGRFIYAEYERALPAYREMGLITIDPKTISLREVFSNEVPDLVQKKRGR